MKIVNENLRKRLVSMQTQVTALNGLSAAPANHAGLGDTFKAALDSEGLVQFEGKSIPVADLITMARQKVPAAISALQELRMETVDLYIRATSMFTSMMWEIVTLKKTEQPSVEHSFRNPVAVRYTGQDGGIVTVKAVKARKITYFNMRELASDSVGYQMRDIQSGVDVAEASRATVDVAWDMANKIDMIGFNLAHGGTINGEAWGTTMYGAFTTTGTPLNRTYIAHPRIQTANLPTTNKIINSQIFDVVAGVRTAAYSNYFRFAVIRAIMNYCNSWGNVWGENIQPTGAILIPSSEVGNLAEEIQPTGTFYNQTAEGVLNSYTRFQYMDKTWTLIGDPTLPPGACYPVLNKPLGKIFVKPEFDMEFVESNPQKNWEERSAMKVIAFATYEPMRVNALKVVYSSVANAGVVTTNE